MSTLVQFALITLTTAASDDDKAEGVSFWESLSPLEQKLTLGACILLIFMFLVVRNPDWTVVSLEEASKDDDPRVYFDITIGDEEAGRIVMQLFKSVVPKRPKISGLFVPERRAQDAVASHCTTRGVRFIESSHRSCARAEI